MDTKRFKIGMEVQTVYGPGVITSRPEIDDGERFVEFPDGSGCSFRQILPSSLPGDQSDAA